MGMYDTVIIEGLKLPTPSKDVANFLKLNKAELPKEFQTKDLDNALLTFKLDSKGQMYTQVMVATGKKIKQEPFYANWKDNRSFLERVYWKLRYKEAGFSYNNKNSETLVNEYKPVFKKNKLTNTFDIYTYENIANRLVDFDYSLSVVDGKLKKIKLVKSTLESLEDASKRLEEKAAWDKQFAEQIEKGKKFSQKWYYPILKETYNPFIFFFRLAVQSICQKLISWSYRWKNV